MSQAIPGRVPPKRRDWSWRSQAFRGLVYQLIAIALVALGVWFLAHNTLENMSRPKPWATAPATMAAAAAVT